MAKAAKSSSKVRKIRPALSPEARENQMISLAVDLAEQQLLDGTASAQVITHFLKLGSTRAHIEKELLEKQRDLASAKTDSIKSQQKSEEMFAEAMKAMRRYSGREDEDELYEDY